MAADKKRQSHTREHQETLLLQKVEGIKYPRKANCLLQERTIKQEICMFLGPLFMRTDDRLAWSHCCLCRHISVNIL